jgi:hypothetical protein
MNFRLILFLLFTSSGFSQSYNCSTKDMQMKIISFIENHLDSIKKHPSEDVVLISIDYNGSLIVQDVRYYSVALIKAKENADEDQYKIEIGYPELKAFVMKNFVFCPSANFSDNKTSFFNIKFRIPLTKEQVAVYREGIAKGIPDTPQFADVPLNSGYTLDVNQIKLNGLPEIHQKKPFKGKLYNYLSDIIPISDNYYLLFRVLKTSFYEAVTDTVEYQLFYLTGNTSRLILKSEADFKGYKTFVIHTNEDESKIDIEIKFD